MKNSLKILALSALSTSSLIWLNPSLACTTILATPGATTDGSMITVHSDDADNGYNDGRIVYVPAENYKLPAKRPVYPFSAFYPRYEGIQISPAYDTKTISPTKPLGYINQVKHTYAYFDSYYAIMNQHQLSFAEATTASKVWSKAEKGKRIFDISALMRVAAERCTTAKCAIKVMGHLATKYGYYGEGESVLIGDPKEGWLFEICSPQSETGALWVAKKIPDGTVLADANIFRIRDVDPNDPNMMYSADLFKNLEQAGWWNPKQGKLDWLRAVSPGEYGHPYYSLRRIWRMYSLFKPSAKFSPWAKNAFTRKYPFSVKPDKKVSVKDMMKILRDHYQGTQFDTTKGLASGPFGSPYRYYGPTDNIDFNVADIKNSLGAWERPISKLSTDYSAITQSRASLPDPIGGVTWIGFDAANTTVYMPMYAGVLSFPKSFEIGNPHKFSRKSAFWAFNFVTNWSMLQYSYMIKDIRALQKKIESKELQMQKLVDQNALEIYKHNPHHARQYLTQYCIDNANKVVKTWWKLADHLVVKYNKGFVGKKGVGYPKTWLKKVGYQNGPTSYRKE